MQLRRQGGSCPAIPDARLRAFGPALPPLKRPGCAAARVCPAHDSEDTGSAVIQGKGHRAATARGLSKRARLYAAVRPGCAGASCHRRQARHVMAECPGSGRGSVACTARRPRVHVHIADGHRECPRSAKLEQPGATAASSHRMRSTTRSPAGKLRAQPRRRPPIAAPRSPGTGGGKPETRHPTERREAAREVIRALVRAQARRGESRKRSDLPVGREHDKRNPSQLEFAPMISSGMAARPLGADKPTLDIIGRASG